MGLVRCFRKCKEDDEGEVESNLNPEYALMIMHMR